MTGVFTVLTAPQEGNINAQSLLWFFHHFLLCNMTVLIMKLQTPLCVFKVSIAFHLDNIKNLCFCVFTINNLITISDPMSAMGLFIKKLANLTQLEKGWGSTNFSMFSVFEWP
jgi:hypothetical protein